jgi:hypothetical protein
MQVIAVEDVPMIERSHVRQGVFRSRNLLTGEPDTPGNFTLYLVSMPDTYYSPRHRHNFDQIRYQMEGEFDFAADGKMGPGSVGYFPEATYYGPQSSTSSSLTLVLQFGGASGSGYISTDQYSNAMEDLAKLGSFEKGIFTRMKPDGRKLNQDAYEAVWEYVNDRELVYPQQRYTRPVFMQPEHFDWIAVPGQNGCSCKVLGMFSERLTRIAMYKIETGARLQLATHAIYFVINGAGTVDNQAVARHATIYLTDGDNSVLKSASDTELLQLGLPRFTAALNQLWA